MKKFNILFVILVSILGIYMGTNNFIKGHISEALVSITILPVMILPLLLKKTLNLTDSTVMLYLVFVFFAQFVGSMLNVYDTVPMFDKIMHLSSGVISSVLAVLLLVSFKKYDHENIGFNILFIITTTFMVAGLWEIFEYSADKVFSGDAQRVIETGINDTMQDIIAAFFGAISFCILYAYEKINKVEFVISKYIKELVR
ncbi:MAG: hypothetical protein WDA12_02610 [Bacilli bacterium]